MTAPATSTTPERHLAHADDLVVTRVEAVPFAIPYTKPLRFASGEVRTAEHVLVRVHTAAGVVGQAEAPPRPFTYGETQSSIVAVVDQLFGPALVGTSVLDREVHRTRLHRTIGNPTAKAALDMAAWDAVGQFLGQPVHRLLGGYAESVPVSHMLGFDEPQVMVEEAARMRDLHGISTFKVKVGRHPYRLDVAVVRALREAFGEEIELYVDGNRGWTASESARAMAEMADLGLTLAEELNPADDVLGRRWLVERCPVPFVADESAHPAGGGHPGDPRRLGDRGLDQDRAHRVLRVAAGAAPGRGAGRRGGRRQPDRRPDRHAGLRHLRRRARLHLGPRGRAVQLPRHERRPAGRAAHHHQRPDGRPHRPRAGPARRRRQAGPLPAGRVSVRPRPSSPISEGARR
ncbi:mandelate racemase/muconate lactonizing enzyme family protein [Ornithinimicrobium sp. W1665]|uniref:mandelate racemase/muconate lactonizing enzyme family protein n=1 Tax=Ornithinimicrobium sp. W1665 TaxID=3416666 RepID=UPI003D6A309D